MSSVNKRFDILFTRVCAAGGILLDEDFDLDRLLMVYLEKEQLQLLLIVLEPTNKVQVFLEVPLLEIPVELHLDVLMLLALDFDGLAHKLLRKLHDIRGEPSIEREGLHILMGAEHHNEVFIRVNGAMRQANGDHD